MIPAFGSPDFIRGLPLKFLRGLFQIQFKLATNRLPTNRLPHMYDQVILVFRCRFGFEILRLGLCVLENTCKYETTHHNPNVIRVILWLCCTR